LNRPTISEYEIASRLAKAIKNNPNEEMNDSLVKTRLSKQSKFDSNLIIHYTYEKRLQSNKIAIHQLWHQTFEQTPVMNTRLIIGNRNSRTMTKGASPSPSNTINTTKNMYNFTALLLFGVIILRPTKKISFKFFPSILLGFLVFLSFEQIKLIKQIMYLTCDLFDHLDTYCNRAV
jgi:hypothetical protein